MYLKSPSALIVLAVLACGGTAAAQPGPESELRQVDQESLDTVVSWVADDADLRAYAAGAVPATLDRPVLELRAPFSYLSGYSAEVLACAGRAEFVPRLPEPPGDAPDGPGPPDRFRTPCAAGRRSRRWPGPA